MSEEVARNVLQMITGIRIEHVDKSKTSYSKPTIENNIQLNNPSSRDIFNYIKSVPNYRHSTKSVLSHFNGDREIVLDRSNDKNSKIWYSIHQKLGIIRKNIEREERGRWEEEKIGRNKEYVFHNY